MADRGDLPRLALAAVEGAAEHVGLRAADRLHRVPEVRRGRLVGDVPQLAVEAAVPDPEEPLPGELEVVPLHVDRPGLVAEDVDAGLDAGDQVVGRRAAGGRAERHVGHPLQRHVAGGVGERAPVGPAEALELRHPPVELVADEDAAGDEVPGLPGDALVVVADGREAVHRGAVTDDVHDRRPVPQAAELVEGGEGRARVGGLVAERPVELGGVPDRLVDRQPQVGRVDHQVVAVGLDRRGPELGGEQLGQLGELGGEVPARPGLGTPSPGRPAARACACRRTRSR